MAVYDAVDGPHQRRRNVPIRDSDGRAASVILAFAERQLLAINGPERAFRLRPVYPRKQTSDKSMSGKSHSSLNAKEPGYWSPSK